MDAVDTDDFCLLCDDYVLLRDFCRRAMAAFERVMAAARFGDEGCGDALAGRLSA